MRDVIKTAYIFHSQLNPRTSFIHVTLSVHCDTSCLIVLKRLYLSFASGWCARHYLIHDELQFSRRFPKSLRCCYPKSFKISAFNPRQCLRAKLRTLSALRTRKSRLYCCCCWLRDVCISCYCVNHKKFHEMSIKTFLFSAIFLSTRRQNVFTLLFFWWIMCVTFFIIHHIIYCRTWDVLWC